MVNDSKSLNHKIQVNTPYQNQYPKNVAYSSNNIENLRQNHCSTKSRSLTYIYSCRSNLMSHWIHIFSPPFRYQKRLQDMSESLDHEMYVTDPHTFYVVNLCITWIQYSSYEIYPSNSLQDIRQNHWTMKYRSLTYINVYSFSSMFVSHQINISSTTFIHQIHFTTRAGIYKTLCSQQLLVSKYGWICHKNFGLCSNV